METIAQHDMCKTLPFVSQQGDKRKNWLVSSSGDYEADYRTGRQYARKLLEQIHVRAITPFFMAVVMSDMPLEKGPIENGFIAELTRIAASAV